MEQEYKNDSQQDILNLIENVFSRYSDGDYIKSSMIPDIDMYVDQITTFLTKHLTKTMRYDTDKIMTKTMINNYTKNHLLPPPEKKKYSKDHVLLLIFIYYFKNFLPISDIQTILEPLTSQYFQGESALNLESVYDTLFSSETTLVKDLLDDVIKEFHMSSNMFTDCPKEERDYLQKFTFICILSMDIYIKKQLIEEIVDHTMTDKK
jgi:DNA-binding transcriptional MerR regulator